MFINPTKNKMCILYVNFEWSRQNKTKQNKEFSIMDHGTFCYFDDSCREYRRQRIVIMTDQ